MLHLVDNRHARGTDRRLILDELHHTFLYIFLSCHVLQKINDTLLIALLSLLVIFFVISLETR